MDAKGNLYALPPEQPERAAKRLEHATGPLELVPAAELSRVQAMTGPERRAWFVARKAERKRQRQARKRQRRRA